MKAQSNGIKHSSDPLKYVLARLLAIAGEDEAITQEILHTLCRKVFEKKGALSYLLDDEFSPLNPLIPKMAREFMFNPDYVGDTFFLNELFSRHYLVDWNSGIQEVKKPGLLQKFKKPPPKQWHVMTREEFVDIVPLLHGKPQSGEYKVHHLSSYVAFVERQIARQRLQMIQIDPDFTNRVLSFAFYVTNDGSLVQRIIHLSHTMSQSVLNRMWSEIPGLEEGSHVAPSFLSSVISYHPHWLKSISNDVIADQFLKFIRTDSQSLYSILARSSDYITRFPQHGLPHLIKEAPNEIIELFLSRIKWHDMELALGLVQNKVNVVTSSGFKSVGRITRYLATSY
jgi:hypothetical protein